MSEIKTPFQYHTFRDKHDGEGPDNMCQIRDSAGGIVVCENMDKTHPDELIYMVFAANELALAGEKLEQAHKLWGESHPFSSQYPDLNSLIKWIMSRIGEEKGRESKDG